MNSVVGAAPRRALVGIVALLLSSCSISPSATATSWPAPRRPLTPDEQLEMAISESDLVGVGRVVGLKDSLDQEGTLHRWMVFQPQRWLKGDAGSQPVRVYFSQVSDFGWSRASELIGDVRIRCVVFAHELGDGRRALALSEHPEFPGMGILRLSGQQDGGETSVALSVENLRPENLSRRSTLVVVGETEPCAPRRPGCSQVRVDSVLVGTLPAGSLQVFYGAWGAYSEKGKTVFMLRRADQGAWEVIGYKAGALRVEGNRLAGTGEPVPQLAARIRAATRHPENGRTRP